MTRAARLRSTTWVFLAVSAVSSAGNGLVYPLVAVYLSRARHLDLAVASAYFVGAAVAGIAISMVAGVAVDRVGARRVAVAGMACEGLGLFLFSSAASLVPVVLAGVVIGAGNGAFFTALTPLLTSMESDRSLDRAFSLRYWTLNLGGGIGLLAGGSVIVAAGERVYARLFLADGLTSLVFAAVIAVAVVPRPVEPARLVRLGLRRLAADRPLGCLLAAHAITVMFGFALFESVVPAVFVLGGGGSGALADGMLLTSVIVVGLAQLPLSRWTENRSRSAVLRWQAMIWGGAGLLMAVILSTAGPSRWAALVYGGLFGVGECLHAATFRSLVARAVPAPLQGRLNGALSLLYGVGLAVGPPIGFWLFQTFSARAFWLLPVVASGVAAVLWSGVAPLEQRERDAVGVAG